MYVTRHSHVVDHNLQDSLWNLYVRAYLPEAELTATHEMLDRLEFNDQMTLQSNRAWVVWDAGVPVAMTLIATDVRATRWLSELYFAKHYPERFRKGQVHYVVCREAAPADVLEVLQTELLALQASPAETRDTTLLILPDALSEFLAFNDFLYPADKLLRKLKLSGDLQIASFHPDFQFADAEPDDIGNFTNRSPYPTLHLLREESIDRAVEAFPEAEMIYETNIETMDKLGLEGWKKLDVGPTP